MGSRRTPPEHGMGLPVSGSQATPFLLMTFVKKSATMRRSDFSTRMTK